MMIPGTGHACRYGDSSFFGRWYGANVHVTTDSRLWGWLDQEAIVPE